jgi:hypothetical protein
MEVSMSFCLSDLRKVESEGAWAEMVDGMIGAVLWSRLKFYEVGVPLELWRYGMMCLGGDLSDSGRGILKARGFYGGREIDGCWWQAAFDMVR